MLIPIYMIKLAASLSWFYFLYWLCQILISSIFNVYMNVGVSLGKKKNLLCAINFLLQAVQLESCLSTWTESLICWVVTLSTHWKCSIIILMSLCNKNSVTVELKFLNLQDLINSHKFINLGPDYAVNICASAKKLLLWNIIT